MKSFDEDLLKVYEGGLIPNLIQETICYSNTQNGSKHTHPKTDLF